MKVKDIFYSICLALFVNLPILSFYMDIPASFLVVMGCIVFGCCYIYVNIKVTNEKYPSKRLYFLASGCQLLQIFSLSTTLSVLVHVVLGYRMMLRQILLQWLGCIVFTIVFEAILFWNGIIRVYMTSLQLGVKHRVLGVICAFIPFANVWYLIKIIRVCADEVVEELAKHELNQARAEDEICKTKHPILLVHGVFFRDSRYLNYWGRIPAYLIRNGATIYYGSQQSADTVMDCGKELAEKIQEIVEKTGCEKVNIIAHSKGGLDSRAAITHFGAAPYVASLTTINTPHRGCIFAEYLLGKASNRLRNTVAKGYNTALSKLGDIEPDFLGAVGDLTQSACMEMNENTPNSDEVLYESVASYCKRARSGQFPLNLSYHFVKKFDGQNDGLVSVESAKWGSKFTIVEPKRKRGISHADMVDLNRQNVPGFDVREFYVSLVASLKDRGY